MDLLLTLIAIEIIASKFLASYIFSYSSHGSYEEKNPLLRFVFNRIECEHDEWLSFFCTILLTGFSVYLIGSFFPVIAYQALFIMTGFYVTILNLGAAHSSYFQKNNFITRKLLR